MALRQARCFGRLISNAFSHDDAPAPIALMNGPGPRVLHGGSLYPLSLCLADNSTGTDGRLPGITRTERKIRCRFCGPRRSCGLADNRETVKGGADFSARCQAECSRCAEPGKERRHDLADLIGRPLPLSEAVIRPKVAYHPIAAVLQTFWEVGVELIPSVLQSSNLFLVVV